MFNRVKFCVVHQQDHNTMLVINDLHSYSLYILNCISSISGLSFGSRLAPRLLKGVV